MVMYARPRQRRYTLCRLASRVSGGRAGRRQPGAGFRARRTLACSHGGCLLATSLVVRDLQNNDCSVRLPYKIYAYAQSQRSTKGYENHTEMHDIVFTTNQIDWLNKFAVDIYPTYIHVLYDVADQFLYTFIYIYRPVHYRVAIIPSSCMYVCMYTHQYKHCS